MARLPSFRILAVLFLATTVLASSAALYLYQFELQPQRTTNINQAADLNSSKNQISSLNSQVLKLSAPNLVGNFTYYSIPIVFVPSISYMTTASGAYANTGNQTATNMHVTFTFYSSTDKTGPVLCTASVALGNVTGQSAHVLPQASCPGTQTAPAQSFQYVFSN